MKWLIWKEYRLQRLILGVGLFLLILPYTVLPFDWWQHTGFASLSGMILSVITLALLGGNAIACERADRSAEFQAYQPIPRGAILASKLVLPVLAATVVWGAHLLIYALWAPRYFGDGREWLFVYTIFGFCAFSVAWFASALQSSPTFAVGAGIAAPVATLMCLALTFWAVDSWVVDVPSRWSQPTWLIVNALLGLICFVWGSWYYLRRVEP